MIRAAGADIPTGVSSAPVVRSCEICHRPGILLPRCSTCQRDYGYGQGVVIPLRAREELVDVN